MASNLSKAVRILEYAELEDEAARFYNAGRNKDRTTSVCGSANKWLELAIAWRVRIDDVVAGTDWPTAFLGIGEDK